MIEQEKRSRIKLGEAGLAVSSGVVIGFAVAGHYFLHIPPLVSITVFLEGAGVGFFGAGLVNNRERDEWFARVAKKDQPWQFLNKK